MYTHESYREVLSENISGRHVFGSSAVIVLLLAALLAAASII